MTDKELLELAAKAAGIELEWNGVNFKIGIPFRGCNSMMNYETWNPLTDDGDALRLAVKLGVLAQVGLFFKQIESITEHDEYAATRRAIVRAAAEIGKTL